jgi:hypothetical protein
MYWLNMASRLPCTEAEGPGEEQHCGCKVAISVAVAAATRVSAAG